MCSALWYFEDVLKCYLSMFLCYLFFKYFSKTTDKNKEGWTETITPPWLNSFPWELLRTLRTKRSYLPCFSLFIPSVFWNLGMITLIRMDPQLHTPMCFFLSRLSFCDLCYLTAISPKMLVGLFAKNKSISLHGCALHSDAYIFPFLLCFSLLFFSQLFVRPPQIAILLFCIPFPREWSWSLSPVQCHEPLSIVHQALYQT